MDTRRDDPQRHRSKGKWGELLSGKNGIHALALAGGVTLHAVNIYIVTTVLPSVVRDIGGLEYYAWSTTLFVVASILGSALSTRLLRSTGPRGAYAVAALVFALGTMICAAAPGMSVLLAGRFVQGVGGGFLYALAYSMIRIVFPESLWSRAIGLVSAMWGVSTLVGPAVGGIFAEFDAWRAAFWSLVPLIGVFGSLAFATLPRRKTRHSEDSALPILQLVLLSAAVLAVSAGSVAHGVVWNLAGLMAALALVAALIAVEIKARARLLPSGALSGVGVLGLLYVTVALLVIGMQPDVFVPYFLQVLHAQSPLRAGYLAALIAMGWTVGSMLSSGRSERMGLLAVAAGPLVMLVGVIALAVCLPIAGTGEWTELAPICVGLVLLGLGIGIAWPHLVTNIFRNAPAAEQDLAAGAMTTVQLFATALGAAAAGMVANAAGITVPGGEEGASSAALWLFAGFAIAPVACLATAIRVPGQPDHVRSTKSGRQRERRHVA
jgi:MFS family permease